MLDLRQSLSAVRASVRNLGVLFACALTLAVTGGAHGGAGGRTWLVTADTTLADGDLTHEGAEVTVRGATLTINGAHSFGSLTIERNAGNQAGVVTHGNAFGNGTVNGVSLTIAGSLFIEGADQSLVESRFDATARGFGAGQGPGAASNFGCCGVGAGGAGHAGRGGHGSSANGAGGSDYGSFSQPVALGSGGGSSGAATGGSGGGAIRLSVGGTLTVNGAIRANGGDGLASGQFERGGGGAGGSIWIDATTVAGTGRIQSHGGTGATSGAQGGGGGAGGRIAVLAKLNQFRGEITACGGTGIVVGGAGTAWLNADQSHMQLVIDNCGLSGEWTPFRNPTQMSEFDLIVRGAKVIIDGAHSFRSVAIERNAGNQPGIVSHTQAQGTGNVNGTWITATEGFSIQGASGALVESRIDLVGCGYPAGQGPGSSPNFPCCAVGAGGAGHGGLGGSGGSAAGVGGSTYGSFVQPTAFGSGGGSSGNATGGSGGGTLRLTVGGALTVDGAILADGGQGGTSGQFERAGGGSGGSIWIAAATLAGTGRVQAIGGNGAVGGPQGGGGGGGRITIDVDDHQFGGTVAACGGFGVTTGGSGTVWWEVGGQTRQLIIDNYGRSGEWTAFAGTNAIDGDLVIRGMAKVGHLFGATGLHLMVAGDATIEPDGSVLLDGRGTGAGQGQGGAQGFPCCGIGAGGAGHAGPGGNGSSGAGAGGIAYGSATQPITLGSGGGSSGTASGGLGGGAIRLSVIGRLTVDGSIGANATDGGSSGQFERAGGGSGGSIWIDASTLAGTGTIHANGGNGAVGSPQIGGGGSGGRIAINSCKILMSPAQVQANGGTGWSAGAAGSVLYSQGAIRLIEEPQSQSVQTGDAVTMTVIADGDSSLTYQWTRNGQLVEDGGGFSGAHSPTLAIGSADCVLHAGEYEAIVTGACGFVFTGPAVLSVEVTADFNGDCVVGGADLGILLGAWGSAAGDLNNDGTTNGADLGILLGAWSS